MGITPEEIDTHQFKVKFRGYDADEVDGFLDELSLAYRTLLREYGVLQDRHMAQQRALENAQTQVIPASITDAVKLLNVAQQSHDQTITEANDEAGRIVSDAGKQAEDIVASGHEQRHARIAELSEQRRALEEHVDALVRTQKVVTDRLSSALEAIGGNG